MLFKTTTKIIAAAAIASSSFIFHATAAEDDASAGDIFGNIDIRLVGPAITSGRISDFAVNPDRFQEFYVATASGGLWKTSNNGITWREIFDGQGSYSIGVVEMDPNNSNVIWVGTGENNSQRSVAFGDGVYKSIDAGKSWKNVGLPTSEHIGQIVIDPRNSDVVYVAAQGPLWNSGGDRGVYKTTDGGNSWTRVLEIDENTGANEILMNAENPDELIATTYQRRRHLWTLINGGPGGGVHRSTDGGATWTKVTSGIPGGELGRIGLAASPSQPQTVYAVVEAPTPAGQGVYRSDDFGVTWQKMSGRMSTSGQYYNEIVVHPTDPDTLYIMDTLMAVSHDAGRTWESLSVVAKHVDEHALWIDPTNPDHMRTGNDGGIYETWDAGDTWQHYRNLPLTQFYRVTADNDLPFYNVYGGTQDNNSLGAPSRTIYDHGIANSDWLITWGGDGFETVVDPTNPNIIYSQAQYGALGRIDKVTGEAVYITPQPEKGEVDYRWNWNSPILISPHNNNRIFYAAEYVFQSDDRGNSWRKISGDLTRNIDRNALEVMGRVWSVDAIAKNDSTSVWGSIIGLSESPLQEGLIIVGSDDGLISITRDGGETWNAVGNIRGAPNRAYVGDVLASAHNVDVMYATFDNHKMGDYKPYVYRSTNGGRSWSSIANNLPDRNFVHTIVEDHVDPNLLFVGTEFGVYFSQNGGGDWHQLKDLPTIAVRDLDIQQRENDLILGTFGRGIYILDDYTPLRHSASSVAAAEATLFPIKDALLYVEASKWGGGRGSQGDAMYLAENPEFGAIFSYYLKDSLDTRAERRTAAESAALKEGEDTPYPSWEELKAEDNEESPSIIFTIRDEAGNVVRRMTGPHSKGFHRVAWDLRGPAVVPVDLNPPGFRLPWNPAPTGTLVTPGTYSVSIDKRVDGQISAVVAPQAFVVKRLSTGIFDAENPADRLAFQEKISDLRRAVTGAGRALGEMNTRVTYLRQALLETPAASEDHNQALRDAEAELVEISTALNGDRTRGSRNEPTPMSISGRGLGALFAQWNTFAEPMPNFVQSYEIAAEEMVEVIGRLNAVDGQLSAIEEALNPVGPWTPGRIPTYNPQ